MDNEFQQLKNKKSKLLSITILLSLGVVMLYIIVMGASGNFDTPKYLLLLLVPIIAYYTYNIKKINHAFKNDILKKCFLEINPTFSFYAKQGLQSEDIYKSLVLTKNSGNKYVSTDLLTGTINEHKFRSADTYIYYVVSNGKSSSNVTVFKGRFYIISLNKNINGHIVIREESNILKNKPKNFSLIELEGIAFNKKFNIYGNNELEVFKQIKPQQIERITNLESQYDGKLLMAIKDDELYFGFWNNQDYFEIKQYQNLNDIKNSIKKEIDLLEKIINILS